MENKSALAQYLREAASGQRPATPPPAVQQVLKGLAHKVPIAALLAVFALGPTVAMASNTGKAVGAAVGGAASVYLGQKNSNYWYAAPFIVALGTKAGDKAGDMINQRSESYQQQQVRQQQQDAALARQLDARFAEQDRVAAENARANELRRKESELARREEDLRMREAGIPIASLAPDAPVSPSTSKAAPTKATARFRGQDQMRPWPGTSATPEKAAPSGGTASQARPVSSYAPAYWVASPNATVPVKFQSAQSIVLALSNAKTPKAAEAASKAFDRIAQSLAKDGVSQETMDLFLEDMAGYDPASHEEGAPEPWQTAAAAHQNGDLSQLRADKPGLQPNESIADFIKRSAKAKRTVSQAEPDMDI